MIEVCFTLFCGMGIWNLVMLILLREAKKKDEEYKERVRHIFVISSVFFLSSIVLLITAVIIVGIFIEPIFYM